MEQYGIAPHLGHQGGSLGRVRVHERLPTRGEEVIPQGAEFLALPFRDDHPGVTFQIVRIVALEGLKPARTGHVVDVAPALLRHLRPRALD